jgi:hypothetical protein
MGGISNPVSVSGAATYLTLENSGGQIRVDPQNDTGAAVVAGVGSGVIMNLVAGQESGFYDNQTWSLSTIVRSYRRDSTNGDGCFASVGSVQPFGVGGAGAAASAKSGGFICQIYAGPDIEFYSAASKPGFFIGLTSTLGRPAAGQLSTVLADAMGLIVDSTAATLVTSWSWITKRGNGAPQITNISPTIAVSNNQLFALQFSVGPASDAIMMTIRQLTAPGTWGTVVGPVSLAGIGAAVGTRVGPTLIMRNFVNSGNQNGIMFNRVRGVCDPFEVPSAF